MPASRSHFHFDELLRAVMRDIFGEFDEARLAELIPRLSTVELAAGQVLVCEGEQSDATGKSADSAATSAGNGPAPSAAPPDPLQAPQLRERLNIFEDGVLKFSEPGAR